MNLIARGGGKMSGDASGLEGVGLFASWELDLWGRVRSATKASEAQYVSAQLDTEYARQSIAALVTKGWIVAVEARLQRALAQDMLASSERIASLARDRLRVGNGDQFDVAVADANSQALRDTVRVLDLSYTNALRALEVLVGRYPAAVVGVADALPAWPGDTPAGIPSELLERRPDVVAAERRVAAAFYRTQEAKAARLPRISLVANATSVNSELFVLQERDNPVLSAGAGIVQPLFLGGQLQAQVEVRTAEQKAAVADYGKVGLRAFNEVESTLAASAAAGDRERILAQGVADNRRALDLANIRYRVGSLDLRSVQQQQVALDSARGALLHTQSDRLVQLVNLHLSLGGSFEPRPEPAPQASAGEPPRFTKGLARLTGRAGSPRPGRSARWRESSTRPGSSAQPSSPQSLHELVDVALAKLRLGLVGRRKDVEQPLRVGVGHGRIAGVDVIQHRAVATRLDRLQVAIERLVYGPELLGLRFGEAHVVLDHRLAIAAKLVAKLLLGCRVGQSVGSNCGKRQCRCDDEHCEKFLHGIPVCLRFK